MEMNGGIARRKITRETSPDRARIPSFTQHKDKGRCVAKKVQVVYYLSRNGQLEHPHFLEISHLPHHHLHLRDVIDRLTVLRGKGMLSLFSWSCKRSYKNGYVWNDLSENDLIYPVDGAEYVLKGSEIIHASCVPPNSEEEAGGKHTGGELHHIQCSTAEIERAKPRGHRSRHTEIAVDDSSPPSSSSSDKANSGAGIRTGCASFRFDDGEPAAAEAGQARNSVLLQLISCGTIAVRGGRAAGGGMLKAAGGGPAIAGRKSAVAEKEYFSGSIVEGMTAAVEPPELKKSSSYKEERGAKLEIEAEENGEAVKGKCIPGRKRS